MFDGTLWTVNIDTGGLCLKISTADRKMGLPADCCCILSKG